MRPLSKGLNRRQVLHTMKTKRKEKLRSGDANSIDRNTEEKPPSLVEHLEP